MLALALISTNEWLFILGALALVVLLTGYAAYRLLPYWQLKKKADEMKEEAEKQLADKEPVKVEEEPGRNEPCPCGSGKKYKKCHGHPSRQNETEDS